MLTFIWISLMGIYTPAILEPGEPGDSFELKLVTRSFIQHLLNHAGPYFQELQQ